MAVFRRAKYGLAWTVLVSLPAATCHAQQTASADPKYSFQWSAWGGGSVGNGHVFGYSKDRRLDIVDLQLAHPLWRFKENTLSYKIAVVPVAVLEEPRASASNSSALTAQRRFVYGAGASPVGAEFAMRTQHALQPFVDSTGGFLYFADRVFSPLASQFNFTVDLGAGLRIVPHRGPAVLVGYRYLHVSNANISARNPGGDFQVIYIGLGGNMLWKRK